MRICVSNLLVHAVSCWPAVLLILYLPNKIALILQQDSIVCACFHSRNGELYSAAWTLTRDFKAWEQCKLCTVHYVLFPNVETVQLKK